MNRLLLFALLVPGWLATAFADLAVKYESQTYFYKSGEDGSDYPADYLPSDALHVLIWSPTAPPEINYARPGTGVGSGEYVLYSSNVDALRPTDLRFDSGRFDYTSDPLVFSDADVGDVDINTGYVYSRIFSTSAPEVGSWYYQTQVVQGPALTEYNALSPDSIFNHTTSSSAEAPSRGMGIGSGMYQVIPEPATGVLALTALGMMIYRRTRKPTPTGACQG